MKKTFAVSILAAAAAGLSANVAAEGPWRASFGVGLQTFDGGWDLDDVATGVIGIERQLSDDWGVEFRYMNSSPDHKYNSNIDADLNQGSLDLLRYYGGERWKPYAAIGLGHAEFDFDGAGDNAVTQANIGGGVRYLFDDNWSARLDLRAINSLDVEQTDGLVTLGVAYAFGDSKPKPKPAPIKPMEKDSDGDGVGDTKDRCANTPIGVVVNASGCPLDTDGDGVADYKDKCPQTPAGRQVDEMGCKFVLTRTEQIRMEVNFVTNSAEIPAQYQAEIAKVADFLKKFGGVSAVIEGHSDSTGADAYNKTLSQRRADAVKAALVTRYGIDASRLTAIGYGEERPIATNDTREGRKQNRRVVAVLKAEVSE